MILSFDTFSGLALFWLALCCFCGVRHRFGLFLAVGFLGLSATSIWLGAALKVAPLDPSALLVLGAGAVCAVTSYIMGRFMGRIQEAWRDSRVDDSVV